jgi:4-amino-4-deoxy-L-arabinose transferase-like glycosyltransferase
MNAPIKQPLVSKRFMNLITWLGLLLIILLASWLRVGAVTGTIVDHPIRADAYDYVRYASNLLKYKIYSRSFSPQTSPDPDALRSPGYPWFLTLFASADDNPITFNNYINLLLTQAVLGVLTVLLTFLAAFRLGGRDIALGVALLTAISPHLVNTSIYILSENIFTFLLALLTWLITYLKTDQRQWGLIVLIGIILAVATLTRPTISYFIYPFLLLCWWRHYLNGKTLLILFVLYSGITGSWALRNWYAIGQTSDPTLTINALHHGMYPDFMYNNQPESFGYPYRFDPKANEINQSVSTILHEIKRHFIEEPSVYLKWYLIGKPSYFLGWKAVDGYRDSFVYNTLQSPYDSEELFKTTFQWAETLHIPLVALSLFFTILIGIRFVQGVPFEISIGFLALLLSYMILLHIIVAPFPRYSTPLLPTIYLAAMLFLKEFIHIIFHLKK